MRRMQSNHNYHIPWTDSRLSVCITMFNTFEAGGEQGADMKTTEFNRN